MPNQCVFLFFLATRYSQHASLLRVSVTAGVRRRLDHEAYA